MNICCYISGIVAEWHPHLIWLTGVKGGVLLI